MGYLDNTSITVDAILTKKGRELLAKGRDAFKITQFALADDEVDYDLWNPAHPLGKNYYGVAIESMPVTEAVPDETQVMKYKLLTYPKGTLYLPVLQSTDSSLSFGDAGNVEKSIDIWTVQRQTSGNTIGALAATIQPLNSSFTFTLLDSTYVQFAVGANMPPSQIGSSSSISRNLNTSMDGNGTRGDNKTSIRLMASNNTSVDKTTKLIITGNDTGGRIVIPITIKPLLTV